jgi:DNA primase
MRYTEDFTRKVLDKTDIVKVIQQYTPLHKEGDVYVGKCNLHNDAGESIVVYPDKQSFHCFGCGKGGNAAVFLMEAKGVPMYKAVAQLAKEAGIWYTQDDIAKKQNNVLKANLYNIYKDTSYFYKRALGTTEGSVARDYLDKRGLTEETIKSFNLGYAPTKGDALYKFLSSKGYTEDLMIQAGLIRISESGQPYDMFRGRVIFPIMDEKRRVIAFGGRRLADETEMDKRQPKYLNSPETPIFNKSNTFYGVHDLKDANRSYFLLCEGYMDVISLHQAGFKNAVAALGTAFTPTHVPEIKKYTNNLVLTFDSDGAGQKAAMRAIKAVENTGIGVRVLSMTPCKDPDEFIKTFGKNEYAMRINRSVDQIDFQLKFMATQYDINDPQQKQAYLAKAVDAIIRQQEREISQESPIIDRN